MNIMNDKDACESHVLPSVNCNFLEVSCNWQILNNKQIYNAITTVPLSQMPQKIDYDDVVSFDTCIAMQSTDSNREPCMLDIKVTDCYKIAGVAIVSEANVLEIFKQFGEYEKTIFAEFIDDYDGNFVYLAETMIQPPTPEVGIKFTKTRNKGSVMWIYGIKLVLTDSKKEIRSDAFNYDVIQTFLSNVSGKTNKGADMAKKVFEYLNKQETINNEHPCHKSLETLALDSLSNSLQRKNGHITSGNNKDLNNEGDNNKSDIDIRAYIDNKFHDMERRLMERIDEMETATNKKLDSILKKLETELSLK